MEPFHLVHPQLHMSREACQRKNENKTMLRSMCITLNMCSCFHGIYEGGAVLETELAWVILTPLYITKVEFTNVILTALTRCNFPIHARHRCEMFSSLLFAVSWDLPRNWLRMWNAIQIHSSRYFWSDVCWLARKSIASSCCCKEEFSKSEVIFEIFMYVCIKFLIDVFHTEVNQLIIQYSYPYLKGLNKSSPPQYLLFNTLSTTTISI